MAGKNAVGLTLLALIWLPVLAVGFLWQGENRWTFVLLAAFALAVMTAAMDLVDRSSHTAHHTACDGRWVRALFRLALVATTAGVFAIAIPNTSIAAVLATVTSSFLLSREWSRSR